MSEHPEFKLAHSVESFARLHNVSRAFMYREIAAGRLVARKIGAKTIITKEDGDAYRQALPRMPAGEASAA